jgi:hypothetical protein
MRGRAHDEGDVTSPVHMAHKLWGGNVMYSLLLDPPVVLHICYIHLCSCLTGICRKYTVLFLLLFCNAFLLPFCLYG